VNVEELVTMFEAHGEGIKALYRGVSEDQARWKPAPDKWSLLEILNHLCDEERDDFRTRLSLTLEDPEQKWPPIDPQGWVEARAYNSRDLEESLADFSRERARSLEWLRSLRTPRWANEKPHPSLPPLKAGDLFASWVAHDLLHIRQIVNTRLAYLSKAVSPFSYAYAG
jgi:hypothetical protein